MKDNNSINKSHSNESSITIVTAFFDIGRAKYKNFKRSKDQYFDYFTKWAKLKNHIIVFVENENMKKAIFDFRAQYDLSENTTVVIIEDIISIAPELYESMNNATSNYISRAYRIRPNNPESYDTLYNYVMLLKAWCLNYVVENLGCVGQLAWIDFGFNHGGEVYKLDSNWNVEWKHKFEDKITFFSLKQLDQRPIFDIVFSMDTYIMGSTFIVPSSMCSILWQMAKECTKQMANIGLSDDDQIIWLMCVRMNPTLFSIKPVTGWHTAITEYGDMKLKRVSRKKESLIKLFIKNIRNKIEVYRYSKRIFSVAKSWTQM